MADQDLNRVGQHNAICTHMLNIQSTFSAENEDLLIFNFRVFSNEI